VRLGKKLQFSREILGVFFGKFFGGAEGEEQGWKKVNFVGG
jgi:hypothetical protein